MGLFLYLLACFITPIFNFAGLISIVFKPKEVRNNVFRNLAISKDQHSGVYVQFIFNKILLKKDSRHLFGNVDETISSVLGKNKRGNTLSKSGVFWANWLNKLEHKHVELSIEDDETQINK